MAGRQRQFPWAAALAGSLGQSGGCPTLFALAGQVMDSDFLDTLLLIIAIGGIAGLILGVLFGVRQAWRRRVRR